MSFKAETFYQISATGAPNGAMVDCRPIGSLRCRLKPSRRTAPAHPVFFTVPAAASAEQQSS
jgi:hypothetical protein